MDISERHAPKITVILLKSFLNLYQVSLAYGLLPAVSFRHTRW